MDALGPSWLRAIRQPERIPTWSERARHLGDCLISVVEQFEDSPRELWVIYGMKMLESFAHLGLAYILVTYLSDVVGMSDIDAGWVYGIYGMLMALGGGLGAFLVDNLGVRMSLLGGCGVLVLARFALVCIQNGAAVSVLLLTLFPVGSALAIPVMLLGVRRYSTEANKSMAFSMFYVIMNLSGCLACFAINMVRKATSGADSELEVIDPVMKRGHAESMFHVILWLGLLASAALLGLAWSLREINVDRNGEVQQFVPRRASPMKILLEVVSETKFWRFLCLTTIFLGVRFIFPHMEATFPKYYVRAFGVESPFELMLGLNAFLVVLLVPTFTYLVNLHGWSVERVLLTGATIAGLSPFVLAISQTSFAVFLWVTLISVGEALWSPKLYEYSVMVAPEGREGVYLAVASAPFFLSKILAGGSSGHLLRSYCPEPQPPFLQGCKSMWALIGVSTAATPALLFLLRRWVFRPEDVTVEHATIKSLIAQYGTSDDKNEERKDETIQHP